MKLNEFFRLAYQRANNSGILLRLDKKYRKFVKEGWVSPPIDIVKRAMVN